MLAESWAFIYWKKPRPMARKIIGLGIAIANLVFHIVGMDDTEQVLHLKGKTETGSPC
jgi:hypothetical protein